ncbi:MAG TPA: polyphosphate kinase 2 [Streptosporangiaceae bacterium]|nr:polyphosphate kinase 2 [Streptosporangiaceae bacterium]
MSAAQAGQLPDAQTTSALLSRLAAELGLRLAVRADGRAVLVRADGEAIAPWQENYPYLERLDKAGYRQAKRSLQIELAKLQRWVKTSGERLLIIFEGRDAAGKGGTIRRLTENLNPRGARVVALEKPAGDEHGDSYLRRYLPHLPAAGEIALFDRSWYNRAGVERVMGFCRDEEYFRFLADAPAFERALVADGVTVVKLWFSITRAEQLRRFVDRHADPLKTWKLSPVDLASLDRWDEYTRAKEAMFRHTDIPEAPWTVVKGNDKRRARLEVIRYVLSLFPYQGKLPEVVGHPDPLIAGPVSTLPELGREESATAPTQVPLSPIPRAGDPASEQRHGPVRRAGIEPAAMPAGRAGESLVSLRADAG